MCPIPLRGKTRRTDPEGGNNVDVHQAGGHFPSRLRVLQFIFSDQVNDYEHDNLLEATRLESRNEEIRRIIRRQFLERLARNRITRQEDWYAPRVIHQNLPQPPPRRQQRFDALQRRYIGRMFRQQNEEQAHEHDEMYIEFRSIMNFNVRIFAD